MVITIPQRQEKVLRPDTSVALQNQNLLQGTGLVKNYGPAKVEAPSLPLKIGKENISIFV